MTGVLLPYTFHQPSSSVPSRIQKNIQCKVLHHRFVGRGGFEPPVHTTFVQTLVSKTSSLIQTRSTPVGRDSRTRTCDLMLPKHAYYQLYYIPNFKEQKTPLLRMGFNVNLKLHFEKFRHTFPIQTSLDVAAVGVLCLLNFSF